MFAMSIIYYTALTHSLSLTELEHLPRALICVNKAGIIEWIEKDVASGRLHQVLEGHGAKGTEVIRIDEGGLVPGLVDTHTVSPLDKSCLTRGGVCTKRLTR